MFLARNMGTSRATLAAQPAPRWGEVLRGVAVANGLECKISCQTSKVRPLSSSLYVCLSARFLSPLAMIVSLVSFTLIYLLLSIRIMFRYYSSLRMT